VMPCAVMAVLGIESLHVKNQKTRLPAGQR
jgi:hypothetical protein